MSSEAEGGRVYVWKRGKMLPTGKQRELLITIGVALKESPNKSITLDLQPNLIKIQAQELIKKKQWKSIEIILHICCFCFHLSNLWPISRIN